MFEIDDAGFQYLAIAAIALFGLLVGMAATALCDRKEGGG